MRFTVTRKIAIGVALILLIGAVSMIVIYDGLSSVQAAMDRLAKIKEPANAAAYEMEIQLYAVGIGVLRYLDAADSASRDFVRRHHPRFKHFHQRYLTFSESPKAREQGVALGRRYEEFATVGDALMSKKDDQEAMLATIATNFDRLDQVIDDQLEPKALRQAPNLLDLVRSHRKAETLMSAEADIAEVGLWLANFQRLRKPEYKDRLFLREGDVRASLTRLKSLSTETDERYWIGVVEKLFDETMRLIRKVLALDDEIREQAKQFVKLREEIDDLLDHEIQVAAREELVAPTRAADQAAEAVIHRIRLLIPLFVLSAVGVTFVLIRVITNPLKALTKGTQAIGRGDLNYRIQAVGRDEFADLANEFNRMVGQLETTTVSKNLLEASEQRLRETVALLRKEIGDRTRAEEERTRLEISLRRSEKMAAMGALVAGVAHEVRNPLFGISSVLDAMDARFSMGDEYQRYVKVLRGEVDRMTALMQDLLDYGRPMSAQLIAGSPAEVISGAVESCAPLAKQHGVQIDKRVGHGLPLVPMERARLAQAFANLLQNAIQHSPQGGMVTVEARVVRENEEAWIECAIVDTGTGIPTEDLHRVFDPFFTRRRGGIGLGLWIVHRIVEGHNGTIAASNRPEGGAVLTVRLPVGNRNGEREDHP